MSKLLYRPVIPFHINQRFDENNACVSTDGENKVIVHDGNNCPVGYKDLYADGHHGALDLRTYHGQPVFCAQRGTVYKIDTNPKSGLDVRIESNEAGRRFRHIYEHLLDYNKKVGDYVETGELIGHADNTGYSSGDHLHFQVEEFLDGRWVKIDPEPILDERFAPQILAINNQIKYLKQQVALLTENIANYLKK